MRRIVVGVDGSESSRNALEWAAAELRENDGELVVVHAWMLPASAHGSLIVPNYDPRGTKKTFRDAAEAIVKAQTAAADLSDVPHQVRLVEGLPGPSLLDASHDAEMVVVGHRARRALAQYVLGSTAQYVTRRSTVPVVVVPERAQAEAQAA